MNPVRSKFLQAIVQQRKAGAIGGDQAQAAPAATPQQATPTAPRRRRSFATGLAGRALLGGA